MEAEVGEVGQSLGTCEVLVHVHLLRHVDSKRICAEHEKVCPMFPSIIRRLSCNTYKSWLDVELHPHTHRR